MVDYFYIFDHIAAYISPAGNPERGYYDATYYYPEKIKGLEKYPQIAEGQAGPSPRSINLVH